MTRRDSNLGSEERAVLAEDKKRDPVSLQNREATWLEQDNREEGCEVRLDKLAGPIFFDFPCPISIVEIIPLRRDDDRLHLRCMEFEGSEWTCLDLPRSCGNWKVVPGGRKAEPDF